jgi:hypothetical protein
MAIGEGRAMLSNLVPLKDREDAVASGLVPYIEAFHPIKAIPAKTARMTGAQVVPPLLRALEDQGLTPMIGHDLATVERLHRASKGRMRRLIQLNDPKYWPDATPADTVVLALLRDGVPQGCVASRLIWCEHSLTEELESGRFWVSDPATMWREADRCIVRAKIADTIHACHVVFTGSIYLAQGVTGGDTLAAMLRLHHLWIVSHWRWSWWVGIVEGALARRHAFDIYGVASMHLGIWRTRPGEGNELHKYELATTGRDAAIDSLLRPETGDLARPMGRPPVAEMPSEGREPGPAL